MNPRTNMLCLYLTNESGWHDELLQFVKNRASNPKRLAELLPYRWNALTAPSQHRNYRNDINDPDWDGMPIEWDEVAEYLIDRYSELFDTFTPQIKQLATVTPEPKPSWHTFLASASVEVIDNGALVELPDEKLPKEKYAEVKKVLENLGGAWSTSEQRFKFDYDPSQALQQAIELKEIPKKNPLAYFPTPTAVAGALVDAMGVQGLPMFASVLEPSAGRGALIEAITSTRPDVIVDAVEIDPVNASFLVKAGHTPIESDFMDWSPADFYDAVIMNPPFDGTAYIDHIVKAFSHLKRGGVLGSIAPNSFLRQDNKKSTHLRDLIERCGNVIDLPDESFRDAGTLVQTVIITLRKP